MPDQTALRSEGGEDGGGGGGLFSFSIRPPPPPPAQPLPLSLAASLVGFTFQRRGNFRWEEIKRNAGFLLTRLQWRSSLASTDRPTSLSIPPNNSRTFNFLFRPKIVSGGGGKSTGAKGVNM